MNLKKLRKLKGLTQTDLAERLGVTQSAYAHYENEVRKLEAGKVPLIARILGVRVEELYGEVKEAESKKASPGKPHQNKRSAKVQQLFEKLPSDEQRVILKQIRLLAQQPRRPAA